MNDLATQLLATPYIQRVRYYHIPWIWHREMKTFRTYSKENV